MTTPIEAAKALRVENKDVSRIRSAGSLTRALQFLLMIISVVAGFLVGRFIYPNASGDGTYPFAILLASQLPPKTSKRWLAAGLLSVIGFVASLVVGVLLQPTRPTYGENVMYSVASRK